MAKTAFLFPGQGAQQVGMGKSLAEKCPAAQSLYERANDILGFDLQRLCFEGPSAELDTTAVSQPALFVTSLAALEWLRMSRPEVVADCQFAAGLSLGEYTALVFAEALSFEQGLKVVQRRGQAMQAAADATPSGMVSILLLEIPKIEELCAEAKSIGKMQIANYLCPGNTVVSGQKVACEKIAELAEQAGGKTVQLSVAGAFHTDIMCPADEQLAEVLSQATIRPPRIPVISNVDALPHSDPEEIRRILVQQVLHPVRWEASMRYLLSQGVDRMYEIGPGKVLKGLMKRIDRKLEVESVNEAV